MINTKNNSKNREVNNQELTDIVLDLSKKLMIFTAYIVSEQQLGKLTNQKQKFLAEILTNPARKPKIR